MKKIVIFTIVATTSLIAFNTFNQSPKVEIKIGETALKVWVADTDKERVRGLSGKTSLTSDEGMLFVFDKPGTYGFWMKEMNFPIDIIWIDDENKVIGAQKSLSPASYPEVFYPSQDIKYALEVRAGFDQEHGLKNGEILSLGQKIL